MSCIIQGGSFSSGAFDQNPNQQSTPSTQHSISKPGLGLWVKGGGTVVSSLEGRRIRTVFPL